MKTTKKKDLNEIVRKIKSPYRIISEQIKYDEEVKDLLKDTKGLDKYDLSKMMPKVTYDNWMVCLYEEDNKFYYINEEQIEEVEPIIIFHCDSKYRTYFDYNGKVIFRLDEIENHISCDYSHIGESDDMDKIVVFRSVEDDNGGEETC